MTGVELVLSHPEISFRSCADCARWVYSDTAAAMASKPLLRNGLKVLRPKGSRTPCQICPKQSPTAGLELSRKNLTAWHHYLRCKAVSHFPDDSIVQRNAALIRWVEDNVARQNGNIMLLARAMMTARN